MVNGDTCVLVNVLIGSDGSANTQVPVRSDGKVQAASPTKEKIIRSCL